MIVVTASTGRIGRHVMNELLAAGTPIRLIVRDASKLTGSIRDRVTMVEGSHGDAGVMNRGLEGADALFWLPPPSLFWSAPAIPSRTLEQVYLDFTRPAVDAIRSHGVRRMVAVTSLGRGTEWQDKAGIVTASLRMDDMIMASGVASRGLAMPSFMDNVLHQSASIRDRHMMFGPIDPDRKTPTVATRDIGAAAVALLLDDRWTGQTEVPVLGPEDLWFNDMASIVSDVLGRTVRYQQTSFQALEQQLLGRGIPETFARGYVDMLRAKNEGLDDVGDRIIETRMATTFRRWCREELEPLVTG